MRRYIKVSAKALSRLAIVVAFLALIRTIAEIFRLQAGAATDLTYTTIKPFLIAALFASIACFIMTILSFYEKYKAAVIISAMTIIALVAIKIAYRI